MVSSMVARNLTYGWGRMGARHDQDDDFIPRKSHLFANGSDVEFFSKPSSNRDSRNLHARFGNLARTKRFCHRLRRNAEHIGVFMRPQPFDLVIGGNADDGKSLLGQHSRPRHGIRGGYVRADTRLSVCAARRNRSVF